MRFLLAAVVAILLAAVLPATAPRVSAQDQQQTRIDVNKITPSVVEGSASPGEVTVSGSLTNTSNRTISDVEARIERGNPADNETTMQQALQGELPSVASSSFTPVTGSIAPGQQVPFELRVPIAGGPDSLQISEPGSFPLLVNVNGVPESGGRARIADAPFTLPVLSPPGAPPPAAPPKPTPATLLVPLVDYPRMEREAVAGRPTVLVDDELAGSLRPGGRLHGLVSAIKDKAPQGSAMGNSLCFAIDPDLLSTVNAMQHGYQVRTSKGKTRPGTGAAAAGEWLGNLSEATKGRCVTPLPSADADVAALGRAGLPDLVKGALDGSVTINQVLKTEPRKDVLWPIDGGMDQPAAEQLADFGIRTMLMRPGALGPPGDSGSPTRLRGQPNSAALPIDPLMSSALDPLSGSGGQTTEMSPGPGRGLLSAQDALGALAFRATTGNQPDKPSILAPPRHWNVQGDDLRSMLSGMEKLAKAQYIQPSGLPTPSPQEVSKLPEGDLAYPAAARNQEIPKPVLDELAEQNFKVGDLYRSTKRDPALNVDQAAVTNPLRDGLLRGASSAWRGNPGGASYWVRKGTDALRAVLSSVRLDNYGGTITRLAADAPTPVTVTNDLPVQVGIVLRTPEPPGVKVRDLGPLTIPPGRRQFWLQTEQLHRAGRFTVDVAAVTKEAGTPLGPTKRLQFASNAYGVVTLVSTIGAGALLIVLVGRRVVRRVRKKREPAARTISFSGTLPEPPEITTTESDRNPS